MAILPSLRGVTVCRGAIAGRCPCRIPFRRKATSASVNLYEVLGVDSNANAKEIKSAFFTLSKKYHPDLNQGDAAKTAKFVEMKDAYALLMDEKKRQEYDLSREQPFASRRTYSTYRPPSTGSARTGRPTPGQPRRPAGMRNAGGDASAGGRTGFEGEERAWRAQRIAEEKARQGEAPRKPFFEPRHEALEWRRVVPNFLYPERQRQHKEKMQLSRRVSGALFFCFATYVFIRVVSDKKPMPASMSDTSAVATAAVNSQQPPPDHNPRMSRFPGERRNIPMETSRVLNDEMRVRELQREKLRIEMRMKKQAPSAPQQQQ